MQTAPALDFAAALADRAAAVERALDAALAPSDGPEARVVSAMRHGALGGGKRLRAFLVVESAALLGADPGAALRVATAVECVHAYSLIHDDLPSMDDDDLRRGKPTTHIAFDEATAVLAGDALQSLAFELIAGPQTAASPQAKAALVYGLARAIGPAGMVAGQMIDLAAEGRFDLRPEPLTLSAIERLQALKTGVLIRFSAEAGALLVGADPGALQTYADKLGLAFQIRDDLLDLEGDEAAAGKRLRKDAAAGKATFIDHLGADGARARAADLVAEAKAALAPLAASAAAPEARQAAARLSGAADFALARTR